RPAIRVTAAELDDVRRQTVAQVKKAFTDTLVAGATLALAGENLRTIDEVERLQRIRSGKGDISEPELTRIPVQRFPFEREATEARQAIPAARIALRAGGGPGGRERPPAHLRPQPGRDRAYARGDRPRRRAAGGGGRAGARRRRRDAEPGDEPAREGPPPARHLFAQSPARARHRGVRLPPRRHEP